MNRKQTVAHYIFEMSFPERRYRSLPRVGSVTVFVLKTRDKQDAEAYFDRKAFRLEPVPGTGKNTIGRNQWAARELNAQLQQIFASTTDEAVAATYRGIEAEVNRAMNKLSGKGG